MLKVTKILITYLIISNSTNCLAINNAINLTYDFPTHMSLSLEHVNRIHFTGKQIKKIVGDSSQYSIILSENRKDMFVQINAEKDQIINFSVIDVAGKVIDFEIVAISSQYPSLITLSDGTRKESAELKEENEVNKMIMAMQQKRKGKYYVVAGGSSFDCGAFGKKTSCQIVADYRFGKYRGVGVKVQNKGRDKLLIDSSHIAKIMPNKIITKSASSIILARGAEEVFYFVTKEEENDV